MPFSTSNYNTISTKLLISINILSVPLILLGISMVVACWFWAGRLMQLPEERRVFFE